MTQGAVVVTIFNKGRGKKMTLEGTIQKYETKFKEASKGLAERKAEGCSSIADRMIIGTLEGNVEEYGQMVSWLKELQAYRQSEKGDK